MLLPQGKLLWLCLFHIWEKVREQENEFYKLLCQPLEILLSISTLPQDILYGGNMLLVMYGVVRQPQGTNAWIKSVRN